MAKKRYSHDGVTIMDHLKKDLIYIDGKDELLELAEYVDRLQEENEQLKKELKRCRDWLNSDKNDYQLTLAFIKSKGYSLKDVLEYEKELEE